MSNEEKIIDLKNFVDDLICNNEYNIELIKGIQVSRADLETLDFYCEELLRGNRLQGRYIVVAEVKDVLDAYGITY